MRAGRMRQRVRIEAPPAADDWTDDVDDWTEVDEIWASVEPLSGRELTEAAQVHDGVTHRVTIRARDDVLASWRLRDQAESRTWNIKAIFRPEELRHWQVLLCEETTT